MPLAWHIEHHMAPKIPDENLRYVATDVAELAARHGLPYYVEPFEKAIWDFTCALAGIPRSHSLWGYCVLLSLALAVGILILYLVKRIVAPVCIVMRGVASVRIRRIARSGMGIHIVRSVAVLGKERED